MININMVELPEHLNATLGILIFYICVYIFADNYENACQCI